MMRRRLWLGDAYAVLLKTVTTVGFDFTSPFNAGGSLEPPAERRQAGVNIGSGGPPSVGLKTTVTA